MTLKSCLIAAGLMFGLSGIATAHPGPPPAHHGVTIDRPLGMGRAPVVEKRRWHEDRRWGRGHRDCMRREGRHHRRDRRCHGRRR